jgi:hypothetical protein
MISPSKSDNRLRTVLFWCLVYALALPAGWAVRVMLIEPLSNLAWAGLLFFLVWFPLRLTRPDLGYFLLLTSSFGPLIGFEALFIGLEANLDMIALLLALLPLLVLFVLFVSVSVFLIPTFVLYLIRFVRSSPPERRSDVHQAQDWLGTRGVGLLKAYGIYLLGAVFGIGIGLLCRRLFGVALDATVVSTTSLLAQSLLIRFVTGGILGTIIYASVQLKD